MSGQHRGSPAARHVTSAIAVSRPTSRSPSAAPAAASPESQVNGGIRAMSTSVEDPLAPPGERQQAGRCAVGHRAYLPVAGAGPDLCPCGLRRRPDRHGTRADLYRDGLPDGDRHLRQPRGTVWIRVAHNDATLIKLALDTGARSRRCDCRPARPGRQHGTFRRARSPRGPGSPRPRMAKDRRQRVPALQLRRDPRAGTGGARWRRPAALPRLRHDVRACSDRQLPATPQLSHLS